LLGATSQRKCELRCALPGGPFGFVVLLHVDVSSAHPALPILCPSPGTKSGIETDALSSPQCQIPVDKDAEHSEKIGPENAFLSISSAEFHEGQFSTGQPVSHSVWQELVKDDPCHASCPKDLVQEFPMGQLLEVPYSWKRMHGIADGVELVEDPPPLEAFPLPYGL